MCYWRQIMTPWIDLGCYEEVVKCLYDEYIRRRIPNLSLPVHPASSSHGAGDPETLDGVRLEIVSFCSMISETVQEQSRK